MIEEYAADETGQADYALEANGKKIFFLIISFVFFSEQKIRSFSFLFIGGKIVDTRCTEYTDEPPQNVVKFFGIPIVHMSKQPNIMIKVRSRFSLSNVETRT